MYEKIISPLVLIYSGHRTGGRRSKAFSIEREGAVHSQFFAIKFKPSGNTEADPFILFVLQIYQHTYFKCCI
jgi:hypothetical protein